MAGMKREIAPPALQEPLEAMVRKLAGSRGVRHALVARQRVL